MKITVDSLLLRSIFAFLLGTILILWSADAVLYLVISIGILFIILGCIPLIMYVIGNRKKHPDSGFPVTGLFCLVFGLSLVVAPKVFVNVMMFILGIILILGGIEQIFTLTGARKWARVSAAFFVMPALIIIIGILVLFNPFHAAESLFILTGVTCLIYGFAQFINWLKFRR